MKSSTQRRIPEVMVCDAIMGSGKSQSAITYMNEQRSERFIYITPYLDEVARIKDSCKASGFVEPSSNIGDYNFKKRNHIAALIKEKKNIVSTHQSFLNYTKEMLDDIYSNNYTLIVDENINGYDTAQCSNAELDMLVAGGYLQKIEGGGGYTRTDKPIETTNRYKDVLMLAARFGTIALDVEANTVCYWTLPIDFLTAFKKVIILTYIFEGQGLSGFLKHHSIPYTFIGVKRIDRETGYEFSPEAEYVPDYVRNLPNMIHIVDDDKVNLVGESQTALSKGWFGKKAGVEQLKKDIYNVFHNRWGNPRKKERLLATFASDRVNLTYTVGKKSPVRYMYTRIPFNLRATNEYSHIHHMAYAANVYMNVSQKLIYKKLGIEVDEEKYALSTMIQCVWRTAIRKGEEIYLYVPSKRMRDLFTNWISEVSST